MAVLVEEISGVPATLLIVDLPSNISTQGNAIGTLRSSNGRAKAATTTNPRRRDENKNPLKKLTMTISHEV